MKNRFALITLTLAFAIPAHANPVVANSEGHFDLNPFDPQTEQVLQVMDQQAEEITGTPAKTVADNVADTVMGTLCQHETCPIYVHVNKTLQHLYLYLNGSLTAVWNTSTGMPGYGTPNMDTHPDGRIYNVYSSKTYPGFDNMPFAVFIEGGFAIHGAPGDEDAHLGQVASHGCIRVHTANAQQFNQLVRHYGVSQAWITIDSLADQLAHHVAEPSVPTPTQQPGAVLPAPDATPTAAGAVAQN
jgi:lipoprotein-anchoring transpeptidase ErfK/SrfK